MVFTRKFSQFVGDNVDEPVGLTDGANTIGPSEGGGGDNIAVIDQPNSFIPGQWVRIDVGTQVYVLALADTPQDAETWWLVIAATPIQFTIQGGVTRVDFSKFTTTIPGILPFVIGAPQYISGATPGLMTYGIPTIPGYVNKPLFIADGPTTGWILSARGYVVAVNQGGNPNMCNMVTVTQPGNGFVVGDVIYATTTPNVYAKAISSGTFAQSDRVGVVVIAGDPTFTYQTEGNAINAIVADDVGAPINPGVRYWLSPTVAGKVTATRPIAANQFSVPVYMPYAVAAGIITPQRSLPGAVGNPAASPPILLGVLNNANNFSSTTVLQDSSGNTFGAYQLIIHSGSDVSVNYGIKATGPNPISIGFRFYIGGVFVSTAGAYASYISGVNSTAGVNTSTLWGNVANAGAGVGRDNAMILPPTSTTVALVAGQGILTVSPGGNVITGDFVTVDLAPVTPIGYTNQGWAGCDAGVAVPTGIQVYFGGVGAAIVAGSTSYILVYGIPNS